MFVITLRFADKSRARAFMDGHNAWLRQGFEDGIFLAAGSLQPTGGGAILAHQADRPAIEARVQDDPFVREGVVHAEILEFSPGRTDARLDFLKRDASRP